MNSGIQKFDIGSMLDEKLDELIQVRGMRRDEAIKLITQALDEWRGETPGGCKGGTELKAYVDLRTHHISREPERTPAAHECQFDDVTAAAIYVANLRRPLLARMRAGKLGE